MATEDEKEATRLRIVAENHAKNRQDVIIFGAALTKIMRQRSAEAMKKTAEKALRKQGYL